MNTKLFGILNLVFSLLIVGYLVMIDMDDDDSNAEHNTTEAQADSSKVESKTIVNTSGSGLNIVYVNTDSLWSNYEFVKVTLDKLEKEQNRLESSYKSKLQKLEKDYNEYMQKGKAGVLSLKQQQDTEAKLTSQQEELKSLENEIAQKLVIKKQTLNNQINDTILAFMNRYRVEKAYDLILQKAYLNGILSATPDLDVTQEVVDRLNQEYQNFK